jgi:hypothetical protein
MADSCVMVALFSHSGKNGPPAFSKGHVTAAFGRGGRFEGTLVGGVSVEVVDRHALRLAVTNQQGRQSQDLRH